MRHIEVYGFDYDYTLASYSNTLHYLIYDLAVKELISTYGVRAVCSTYQHKLVVFSCRGRLNVKFSQVVYEFNLVLWVF